MKTLGIVVALVLGVSVACCAATTATVDLYATRNLISLPQVPINADPVSVFETSGIDPSYNLTKFNGETGGYVGYDPDAAADFGGMLLGEGYWLLGDSGTSITYQAVEDGVPSNGVMTDMWISLPGANDGQDKGGRHLIGTPFAHDIAIDKGTGTGDNIFFTDGTQMLTWGQAVDAGWVSPTMTFYTGLGYDDIWYDGSSEITSLQAGRGYWILTQKDNLAMIVPAK